MLKYSINKVGIFGVLCTHPPEASTTITPEAWTSIAPEVLLGFMGKPEMSRETRYDPCFETIDAVGLYGVSPPHGEL
jgi:hypothetical protein